MENEQLTVQRAISGDQSAMRALWTRHAPHIDVVVRRLVGQDADLAADVAQEVWIQIFRALPSFRGDAQFGTWAHRIAVNRTMNALRRTKRMAAMEVDVEDDSASVEPEAERALLAASIEEAAKKLPAREPSFCSTTSKGIRTRKSPSSWALRLAAPSPSFSRRARSCASCSHTWSMHPSVLRFAPIPRNMQHLHTERLAALGDELPSTEEAAHLAACETCANEVSAYQALVAMAHAEQEAFGLPLTRWDSIAAVLVADSPPTFRTARPARSNRWMLQIAAGLLLVAGGAMAGRMSTGSGPLPGGAPIVQTADAPTSGVQFSSDSTFASVDEARAAQARSEQLYQQATAFLARIDTTGAGDPNPVAYRSRLAALDRVLSTTRDALREAPHDPVINGYYLTTLGQREATLRQLNTALPASFRVNSF